MYQRDLVSVYKEYETSVLQSEVFGVYFFTIFTIAEKRIFPVSKMSVTQFMNELYRATNHRTKAYLDFPYPSL